MSLIFHLHVLFVLTPFAACQGNRVPASNPEISAQITYKIKESIITTVSCLSPQGSLPIRYTLYRNTTLMQNYVAVSRRKAEFVVNLSFSELLETLKCKADNGFGSKYSRGLVIDLSVNLTSKPDPPILGQQLALYCAVTYEPKEGYTWYFIHPTKNMTNVTKQNQFIIEAANSGIYYCSVHGYFSNRIEVPVQDSSFQPVVAGVSVGAILLLILIIGLICYCSATEEHYLCGTVAQRSSCCFTAPETQIRY
ncbi:uncharacterized protein LOC144594940 isoform X2 [Rhinoraja longicauda]